MKRSLILLAALMLLITQASFAQTPSKHTEKREQLWLGYFNQTRLSNHWGFWLDIHYRQTDHFVNKPFQFIIRPALTYFINDNVRFNLGYAYVNHFPSKTIQISRPESRIWQQLWWRQKYSWFQTLQWIRLEERYVRKVKEDKLLTDYNFNFRLRYNYSLFVPLKGRDIVAKTPFFILMDEVFINFGKNITYNYFDQNRFFVGLGYQFTSHLNIHLGYMNVFQQEAAGNKYISTNAIRLFVFQTLDFRNKKKESL